MIERLFTIGAYGFVADTFAQRLKGAGIDLFIDLRARRGVRGAEYAFANAARLQKSLEAAGIRYAHAKHLAPPEVIRKRQYHEDEEAGIGKRQRSRLGDAFVEAYRSRCLADFDAQGFAKEYCDGARRPVLFCVEREPAACHRSLVAERLSSGLGVAVENLMP